MSGVVALYVIREGATEMTQGCAALMLMFPVLGEATHHSNNNVKTHQQPKNTHTHPYYQNISKPIQRTLTCNVASLF